MKIIKPVCISLIFLLLILIALPAMALPTLSFLTINEDIVPGPDSIYLTVTGTYSDGTTQQITDGLSWFSSNKDAAEISQSGRLHFTGEGGIVTITVYKGSASGKKTINVEPWPEDIEIETTLVESQNPYRLVVKAELSDGNSRYLGPEDEALWSTTNPWVAWVNSQGVVTFTGETGHVTIKVVLGDLSDSVNVTVSEDGGEDSGAYRVGIKIKNEIVYSPDIQKLQLVALLSDGTEEELENSAADWTSSDTEVAKINSEGELTFTGKTGFTTIKVSYGGYYYEKLVTVGRFIKSLSLNQSLNYTDAWDGKALPLSATVKYNDGSEYILSSGLTWSADNKNVAEITVDGVLTFTGKSGKVTITVKGQSYDDTFSQDSITIEVPATGKPVPQRLSIDINPVASGSTLPAKVYCLYSDGSLRDVTQDAVWSSGTPETASVYEKEIYLAPNPGSIKINTGFLGLSDQIQGYNHKLSGNSGRVYQLRIKQHSQPFSFKPVKLNAVAVMGDGSIKDVTGKVRWYSTQPLVAKISGGSLIFTGRTGKTVITVQGYGFRDELSLEVSSAELRPQVEKLIIEGELVRGANQLKAVAFYNDGTSRDVTNEAVWNTGNKNIAVVTTQGTVLFPGGLQPVVITAHYNGKEARIEKSN